MSRSQDSWNLDGNSKAESEDKFKMDENDENDENGEDARPSSKQSMGSSNFDPAVENKHSPKRKKRSRKDQVWHRSTFNEDSQHSNNWGQESNDKKKVHINIRNFPTNWSNKKVYAFIAKEYKPVNSFSIETDKDMFTGTVRLELDSAAEFPEVFQCFHDKMVEDSKLSVKMTDSDNESDKSDSEIDERSSTSQAPRRKRQCRTSESTWRPDIDVWETDPSGLYGLKPEFLELLGITPPIDKWVHVSNFRCDKSELKDVMELAGQVLFCSIDTRGPKIAKVMYSHPLEAVQAVSMLNNQIFYGKELKVTITTDPSTILPKGLMGVGPGLGVEGKPIRDIVKQYERFTQSKSSSVNYTLFNSPMMLFDPSYSYKNNLQNDRSHLLGPNRTMMSFAASAPVQSAPRNVASQIKVISREQMARPGPMTSGPMHGPSGSMHGPINRMHGVAGPPVRTGPMAPTGPGPITGPTGPMYGFNAPTNGPTHGSVVNKRSPDEMNTVELVNLPLTTSFPLLCEKMAECGQVMSLQLTSPGCAVVQFAQPTQARLCFQKYNGFHVQGNLIEVKFL